MAPFIYPEVRRDDLVEILHGHSIADPYRHLEDPDALETQAFVEGQTELFQGFLKNSSDVRSKIAAKLTELNNFEKYQTPFKSGDNYYYFYNSGLQAQSVMYTQKSVNGEPTVFFDPNQLSADGTISLNAYNFSKSGKLFGYALSVSGSDWVTIHVREVGSDKDLEEKPVQWAKFSKIEFTHDDKGFFYTKYPTPTVSSENAGTEVDASKNAQVWYHRIGTSQDEDIVVYKNDDEPDWGQDDGYDVTLSKDGRYLVLGIRKGCDPDNLLYFADLQQQFGCNSLLGVPEFTEIVGEWNGSYFLIASEGSVLYFQTSFNAPKSRIVKYDVAPKGLATKTTTIKTTTVTKPESTIKTTKTTINTTFEAAASQFVEVIAEADTPVSFVKTVGDMIVVVYIQDVKHVAKVFDLSGTFLNNIDLPTGANINGMGVGGDGELFYKYASYITPGVICRYDFTTATSSVFREIVVPGLESDKFEMTQVFYTSEDGTRIPMWIVNKKGLVLDGQNPTILYGYGGFGISLLPNFSINFLSFVDGFSGVFCVANIRGGGEYGQEWHDAGRLFNKQNCFTDFQYAARYLIAENFTTPSKLCINGGSNGGLLIGACLNQTPELFGLGIADVGVLDYLRFHLFTVGAAWSCDYGFPDVQKDFEYSLQISPVHNVDASKTYPAVLIVTGDHDDRVVPLHSMKFAATLQHAVPGNPNPIMMRVNKDAGHGAGKSVQQSIEETADKFTYISLVLNAPYHG
ncbi:hypothetical protein HDU98_009554 [Podochytrium sp. JEL0797]|nr:hypothetical protein HDU98_009554 [Podochytrium sp. JEL0797]